MKDNYTGKVVHETITHFYIISIESLLNLCAFGKCSKASKLFIYNIHTKSRELSSVNQWQDSDAVIS